MKTILITAILTLVFLVGMTFLESKRTENLNRIAVEYQEALGNVSESSETDSSSTSTSSDDDDDDDEDDEEDEEEEETITVTLSGAIESEGEYDVDVNTYLYEVVNNAGGLSDDADEDAYNGNYILTEDIEIYIPKTNNNNKISINTADADTLDMLPGIGSTLAKRIVSYRESNDEFEIIEEIKNVEGIGDALFNKIKDYIKL